VHKGSTGTGEEGEDVWCPQASAPREHRGGNQERKEERGGGTWQESWQGNGEEGGMLRRRERANVFAVIIIVMHQGPSKNLLQASALHMVGSTVGGKQVLCWTLAMPRIRESGGGVLGGGGKDAFD